MKPNGHNKMDTTLHANKCLESPLFQLHKLSAYIPSTLIFSHGIIKLDTSIPEKDFCKNLKIKTENVAFKRFSTNRNGNIPTLLYA